MGLFGKTFEEKVNEALAVVGTKVPGLKGLRAEIAGKVVTLKGEAPTLEAKKQATREFQALVEAENVINGILVAQAPKAPPAAPGLPPAPVLRIHEVKAGDTLSAIAKQYYGKASQYMKIFEANKDQLSDPDRIKVGQKLKIPE